MVQMVILPSLEPVAKRVPSFENRQNHTSSLCSVNVCKVSLGKSSLEKNWI